MSQVRLLLADFVEKLEIGSKQRRDERRSEEILLLNFPEGTAGMETHRPRETNLLPDTTFDDA
jgi:hypothetical protein